jgi:hypothetical protein
MTLADLSWFLLAARPNPRVQPTRNVPCFLGVPNCDQEDRRAPRRDHGRGAGCAGFSIRKTSIA